MTQTPPIILASGSQARNEMLRAVSMDFTSVIADIDEKEIQNRLVKEARDIPLITEQIAQAKAQNVSAQHPDALVIGSDQTLEFNGAILSKADSIDEGIEKIKALRGKTHRLYSSVCVVHGGNTVFFHTDSARLTMHNFDDAYLEAYIKKDSDALTSCVGGYKIEGAGAWLFDTANGNHHTIMGMPLLPLLAFLRKTYKILP
tara:strand:- start:26525 stop:27130 length:606 start_codon:yes stop_codon:yes gene_type:complete